MIDPAEILRERLTHELDMDLLKEIQKVAKVDLSKEIELAERKFNSKLDRVLNNITNKSAHETDSVQLPQ